MLRYCPFFFRFVLLFSLPLRPQYLSLSPDLIDQTARIGWGKVFAKWFNPELVQLDEYWVVGGFGYTPDSGSGFGSIPPTTAFAAISASCCFF